MTEERMISLLRGGEWVSVEYKRCSGSVENDMFESVCAFLRRFGGDLLLGVEDDGAVCWANLSVGVRTGEAIGRCGNE